MFTLNIIGMSDYSSSTENTESLYDEETGGLKRDQDSLPTVNSSQTPHRRYDDKEKCDKNFVINWTKVESC